MLNLSSVFSRRFLSVAKGFNKADGRITELKQEYEARINEYEQEIDKTVRMSPEVQEESLSSLLEGLFHCVSASQQSRDL